MRKLMKKHFSLRSLIIVFLSVLCIGLGFLNLLKAVSVSTNAQELCPYMTYGTNEFVSFPEERRLEFILISAYLLKIELFGQGFLMLGATCPVLKFVFLQKQQPDHSLTH